MEHTKTPWRIGRPGTIVADEPVPDMNGTDDVAYYGGHMVAESVVSRNAAFIVRACNAHDPLVAALSAVVSYYNHVEFGPIAQARAALEAAKP